MTIPPSFKTPLNPSSFLLDRAIGLWYNNFCEESPDRDGFWNFLKKERMSTMVNAFTPFLLSNSLMFLLCSSIFAEDSNRFLAKDGSTPYIIVYADEESPDVQTKQLPSLELQENLQNVTHAVFSRVKESEYDGKSPALFVGNTQFARENGVNLSTFAEEQWTYQTIGENVLFAGGKHCGTLYAINEFLEKELGIYHFTFESEYIPKNPNIPLKNWNRSGTPAFLYRALYTPPWGLGISAEQINDYYKFVKFNRGNYDDNPLKETRQTSNCHTFYQYVSWKQWFDTHPEYFSMDANGKRFHGPTEHSEGQLCMSNPEVAEVILNKLRENIRRDREKCPPEKYPRVYDISQCDNSGFICKCPECTKITEHEGSESGIILTCLNHVAREIAKEYPDVIIQTFAYVSTENAPKYIRPEKNIFLRWCDLYTRSDCYRPITSKWNTSRKEQLDGWRAIGANIALWDYWNMGIIQGPYFDPPRMETMVDAIAKDIRYYREAGVKTYFCEMETNLHRNPQNFVDLQIWLGYQLLNNPDVEEESLIQLFMDKHYGPAAPAMKQFLSNLRKAVANEDVAMIYISNPRRKYQTEEFVKQSIQTLRKAQKLASEGTPYRNRVDKELITPLAVLLNHPEWNSGQDMKQIALEYKSLRTKMIETYCTQKKQEEYKKFLDEDMKNFPMEKILGTSL